MVEGKEQMAAQLVISATSNKLKEADLMKNFEICEMVLREPREARSVAEAVKERLGDSHSHIKFLAVQLLDMLMTNCGEHLQTEVLDTGILPILVKIVKKKSDLPVREKILLLLEAMQTSHGGASGKYPQYHAVYSELVCKGVKFTQTRRVLPLDISTPEAHVNNVFEEKVVPPKLEKVVKRSDYQIVPELSINQKANSELEILRDVLDAIGTRHPEAANDGLTLDLVEQCTIRKLQLMHLVETSRDEKVVSRAIELNEKLHKVLSRHEALRSPRVSSAASHFVYDKPEKEEDDEQLLCRTTKGKAPMGPEDENHQEKGLGISKPIGPEKKHCRLTRPVFKTNGKPGTSL